MALMNVNTIGNANFVQSEWFVARITSVASTVSGTGTCTGYKHGWIEQRVCANGIDYEDADEASAEGDESLSSPAYPISGTNAQVNDLVLMRVRGIDQAGNTIYEFIPKGGGGGPENCPRVSNVTCTANMLVVTYQLACEETTAPELQGNCPVGAPVGSILMWTQEPIPTGWLECDGSEFDPIEYPELFDLYGNNIVPDLRASFIRGRGGVAGALNPFGANYPDSTAAPNTPFTISTAPDHTHSNAPGAAINTGGGGTTLSGYDNSGTTGSAGSHTHTITGGGDTETAPVHKVLIYIVKAAT